MVEALRLNVSPVKSESESTKFSQRNGMKGLIKVEDLKVECLTSNEYYIRLKNLPEWSITLNNSPAKAMEFTRRWVRIRTY